MFFKGSPAGRQSLNKRYGLLILLLQYCSYCIFLRNLSLYSHYITPYGCKEAAENMFICAFLAKVKRIV